MTISTDEAIAWAQQLDEAAVAERAIREAHQAIDDAARIERAVRQAHQCGPDDKRLEIYHAQSKCQAEADRLYELQRAECEKFARARGWRLYKGRQGWIYTEQLLAGRMFGGGRYGPRDLSDPDSVIDHRECFVTWRGDGPRTPQSCRYPVAILSHTYGPWEPCVEYARMHGLNVERLPYSWYYPGQCIAVLFTRREQS